MHDISEHFRYLSASLILIGLLTGCTHGMFSTQPAPQAAQTAVIDSPTYTALDLTAPSPTTVSLPRETTPAPPNDSWQRIRNGYQLSGIAHPAIDEAVDWFTKNGKVIRKSSQRATPLLHHIVESVENQDLPTELALIPLLETGYRVHARSPYGALGPWQFMPATGRQYGLMRTAFLDQRRDLTLSTQAALAYLSDLHEQFDGDWLLAIAAYNAGPGTIKKALLHEGQTFWDIVDRLPKETQTYVPKLLAAAQIIDNPAIYSIELQAIPNEEFFETIHVNGPVDFEALETLEHWDKKTFKRLNGALSSTYYGRKNRLAVRVPRGTGEEVSAHLIAVGPPPSRESFQYLVQRGDTLGSIAIRFNVPILDLRRYNGLHGNNIRAGKELTIPTAATYTAELHDIAKSNDHRHIVKPGDSFWTLGRRFGISARTLARHNGHAINKTLYPGQALSIPQQQTIASLSKSLANLDYVVERGDSLWSIAKRFGIATTDLRRWNPLIKSNLLRPGQRLLVQSP